MKKFEDINQLKPQDQVLIKCRENIEEKIKQTFDSFRIFQPKEKIPYNSQLILPYQNYPTAQLYLRTLDLFETGLNVIKKYGKEKVETLEECRFLRPAFLAFVSGHILENSLFPEMILENVKPFVDQYLQLKPIDYMVEYLQFILLYRSLSHQTSDISDYERIKLVIRKGEKLADKMKSAIQSTELLPVRIDLYFVLSTRYSATGQVLRAMDSAEKSYELDKSNYGTLYGYAYNCMQRNPEKAKSLFQKYLQIAPKCDKKYPNAYYMLASISIDDKKITEAFKYQELGENAEKERLPFLQPVNVPQKDKVKLWKIIHNQNNHLA